MQQRDLQHRLQEAALEHGSGSCVGGTEVVYGLLWLVALGSAGWLVWSWFVESSWGARWYLWRRNRQRAKQRRVRRGR